MIVLNSSAKIDHEHGFGILVWDHQVKPNWRKATEEELVPALIQIITRLDSKLRRLGDDF